MRQRSLKILPFCPKRLDITVDRMQAITVEKIVEAKCPDQFINYTPRQFIMQNMKLFGHIVNEEFDTNMQ